MTKDDGREDRHGEFFSGSTTPRFWVALAILACAFAAIPFIGKPSLQARLPSHTVVIDALANVAAIGAAFLAGVGYADRLRHLGRRRRILPPEQGER